MVTIRGHFSLSQHRLRRSPVPARAVNPLRDRWDLARNEITEILPLDGFRVLDDLYDYDADFGDLDDLDFSGDSRFDNATQVLHAPELDDLHDLDDLPPLLLASPPLSIKVLAQRVVDTDDTPRHYGESDLDVTDLPRRAGQHRKQPTSAT